MEDKPGLEGKDPFTAKKEEKRLQVTKQKMRELKN